jgi:hypothetical protein
MNIPKVRPKLKKGDIDLATVYSISRNIWYPERDDKAWRAGLDIKSSKLIARKNFKYNQSTKQWEQTEKRHIKFEFIVSSDPISYKKIDSIKTHKYPVVFLFYDFSRAYESPFRWRTGSLKKLQFAKKGASFEERKRIAENNIKNGIQMQFFFELEAVLDYWGLLYGPNLTNKQMPIKTNPFFYPFFDKTSYYVVDRIFIPLFKNEAFMLKMGELVKNK